MQEKIKVMKKQIQYFIEFVSIPRKNPHRLPTEPMGIHHSPHIHTIPIPMGIPMGIPIPTAALLNPVWHRMLYSCTQMATMGVKGLTSRQ